MRVAVVVVDRDEVALIERVHEGRRYYLFPGGGVEIGERPEVAAVREAREELGLDVELLRLIARGAFGGNEQRYYLARVLGGTFGSGDGEEMGGADFAGFGSYRAVRLPLAQLGAVDVRPRDLATLTAESVRLGWPAKARELFG